MRVGDRVRWHEPIDRYPFFELEPGDGIVVAVYPGLAYVLPLDDVERAEIYRSWGANEREPGSIEAYCLAWTDDDAAFVTLEVIK